MSEQQRKLLVSNWKEDLRRERQLQPTLPRNRQSQVAVAFQQLRKAQR